MASIEWRYRAEHMWQRHHITPAIADEAADDPDAVWFDPDPKSQSGQSARVIGYSPSADTVITVLLLHPQDAADTNQQWIGLTGFVSEPAERRIYQEQEQE